MQLLASWKDSLTLLKPSNFKLFFLVTLKSIKDTYKIWLVYWGWLVIFFLAWEILSAYIMPPQAGMARFLIMLYGLNKMIISFLFSGPFLLLPFIKANLPGTSWLSITYLAIFLMYFSLFLSARPSVNPKNVTYFASYLRHAFYLIAWFCLLSVLMVGVVWLYSHMIVVSRYAAEFISWLYTLLMTIWTTFFALFLLDSDGTFKTALKSVVRSCKLLLYNLPFCLIMGSLMFLIYIFLMLLVIASFYILPPNFFIGRLVSIFFASLVVCTSTNYYVKRIHDQFDVYFGTK